MGGGRLVDGVRRWFHQRRSSTSLAHSRDPKSNDTEKDCGFGEASVSVSGSRAQSSLIREEGEAEQELSVVEDFDLSGLSSIKVPKRNYFNLGPMALPSHKKVSFFLLVMIPLSISWRFADFTWWVWFILFCLSVLKMGLEWDFSDLVWIGLVGVVLIRRKLCDYCHFEYLFNGYDRIIRKNFIIGSFRLIPRTG